MLQDFQRGTTQLPRRKTDPRNFDAAGLRDYFLVWSSKIFWDSRIEDIVTWREDTRNGDTVHDITIWAWIREEFTETRWFCSSTVAGALNWVHLNSGNIFSDHSRDTDNDAGDTVAGYDNDAGDTIAGYDHDAGARPHVESANAAGNQADAYAATNDAITRIRASSAAITTTHATEEAQAARARATIAVAQARAEADRVRAQAETETKAIRAQARAETNSRATVASLPTNGTAVVRPPLVRDNTPDEYEKSPLLRAHIWNLRPITIRTLWMWTDVFLEIIDIFTQWGKPIVGIVCKKNNKVETFAINIDDTRVWESWLRILWHYKNGEIIPMIDPKRSFLDRFRKTLPYTPTYDLASIQSKKRIDTQIAMPSPVVPTQTVATSKNTTEDTNMLHWGSIGDHLANFRKNNPIVIDTVEYWEISIIAIANSSEKHIKKAQFLITETGKTKEYAIDIRCRTGDNPYWFVGWYDANSILQRFTERYSTYTQRWEITGRKSIDWKPLNIRSIRSKKMISVYSSVKQNLRNLMRVWGGTWESSPQIANNIQVNSTNIIKGNIPKTQPEEIRATIRNWYLTWWNLSEHAKNLRAGNEISISIWWRDYQIHQMSEPKPGYSQWIKVRKKWWDGNFSDERIYEIELSEFTAWKQVKLIPVLHNGEKYTVNKTGAKVFHLEQIYSELEKPHSNSQPPTSWLNKTIQSAWKAISNGWKSGMKKLFGPK